MDSRQFDDLARELVLSTTRRTSLRVFGGALLGTALGLPGWRDNDAAEAHDALKKCKKKKGKKKKACIDKAKRHNRKHQDCPDDCGECGGCINGKCLELPGLCDEENCERCNTTTWTCEPTCSGMFGVCCKGECRLTESGPWTECGEFCCQAGKTCCNKGENFICCDPGDICPSPCGDGIDIACCTPEAYANGHCCPG